MNFAKYFNKASSFFFLLGFATAQLRRAPFFLLATVSNLVSGFLYLTGYVFWLLACCLHPDYPRLREHWYGFARFQDQHKIAAILGTIAIVCSMIAVLFPVTFVPACWLFAISNCVWLISEYHKKQNPRLHHENYSGDQQIAYLKYAVVMTSISTLTALSATTALFFPLAAPLIFALSSMVIVCLSLIALACWVDYTFSDHKLGGTPEPRSSTRFMLEEGLGIQRTQRPERTPAHEADNGSWPLFQPEVRTRANQQNSSHHSTPRA